MLDVSVNGAEVTPAVHPAALSCSEGGEAMNVKDGGGGGGAAMFSVTFTTWAVPVPGVKVSIPVYCPTPRPAGFTCAVMDDRDAVEPEFGLAVSQGWLDSTVKVSGLPVEDIWIGC